MIKRRGCDCDGVGARRGYVVLKGWGWGWGDVSLCHIVARLVSE